MTMADAPAAILRFFAAYGRHADQRPDIDVDNLSFFDKPRIALIDSTVWGQIEIAAP